MTMKKYKFLLLALTILTLFCAVLHIIFFINADFADIFNMSIAHFFRFILAKATCVFPFSLAEIILLSSPILIIIFIVHLNKKRCSVKVRLLIAFNTFVFIAAASYILFIFTFASGYRGNHLSEKLDIKKTEVSEAELYETLSYVIEKANDYAEKIHFTNDGSSELTMDYRELSSELCHSYDSILEKYELGQNYNSSVKPLLISPIMTYTHISGVYSFFTGEANLNTNYPDYVCVFSAAHELAHQRGFAREDEANFIAYLVCIESDNDYLKYAGYLSMYGYLSSALRSTNYDLWIKATSSLSDKTNGELIAYSIFFDKYRDNAVSDVSDTFNDTYLKLQGTQGVKSYGMVIDLAIAYHSDK